MLHHINPFPQSFLKINFNIIIPCTPTTFRQSHSLRLPHLNPVFTSLLPPYAACPFHLIPLDLITKWYLVSAYHDGPHYEFPPVPLSGPSQVLVPSTTPWTQKHLAYATNSLRAKFHTHIKENSSVYFNICILDKRKRFWTKW